MKDKMPPIMVTGAAGLLGHALVPHLQTIVPQRELLYLTDLAGRRLIDAPRHTPDIEALDVTDEGAVTKYTSAHRPGTVIHLAAYTDVDGCETNHRQAMQVNAEAPGIVARAAAAVGALMVYISTDFIFDGEKSSPYVEDDRPRPINVYGQSKLKGEQAIAAATDRHLIIRTAWLYGNGGENFVDNICNLARQRGEVRVVSDLVGSPTWTRDLARAMIALLEAGAIGTYHACGRGEATWYDLAACAIELAKINATVRPVSTREFARPARRPAYSVLSCEKLLRDCGYAFPPWRHSLRAYITEKR